MEPLLNPPKPSLQSAPHSFGTFLSLQPHSSQGNVLVELGFSEPDWECTSRHLPWLLGLWVWVSIPSCRGGVRKRGGGGLGPTFLVGDRRLLCLEVLHCCLSGWLLGKRKRNPILTHNLGRIWLYMHTKTRTLEINTCTVCTKGIAHFVIVAWLRWRLDSKKWLDILSLPWQGCKYNKASSV